MKEKCKSEYTPNRFYCYILFKDPQKLLCEFATWSSGSHLYWLPKTRNKKKDGGGRSALEIQKTAADGNSIPGQCLLSYLQKWRELYPKQVFVMKTTFQ